MPMMVNQWWVIFNLILKDKNSFFKFLSFNKLQQLPHEGFEDSVCVMSAIVLIYKLPTPKVHILKIDYKGYKNTLWSIRYISFYKIEQYI